MALRIAAASIVACALACSSGGSPPASAESPAAAPNEAKTREAERPPPSKRILGRWTMNLNDVPKEALAEELRRFKSSQELADMVRVEYVVTDTEWMLHKYGAGGVYDQKWHYQIIKEVDDVLVLERIDEHGGTEQIQALVGDDKMMLGTGAGKVPLVRVR